MLGPHIDKEIPMHSAVYFGCYVYLTSTCPRQYQNRILFTVARTRATAREVFRAYVATLPGYSAQRGIMLDEVTAPVPKAKYTNKAFAHRIAAEFLRYGFTFVDPETRSTITYPETRFAELVTLCTGNFTEPPSCNEMHAHTLDCGHPDDRCTACGASNADHERL